jgi:hypothetical protein
VVQAVHIWLQNASKSIGKDALGKARDNGNDDDDDDNDNDDDDNDDDDNDDDDDDNEEDKGDNGLKKTRGRGLGKKLRPRKFAKKWNQRTIVGVMHQGKLDEEMRKMKEEGKTHLTAYQPALTRVIAGLDDQEKEECRLEALRLNTGVWPKDLQKM